MITGKGRCNVTSADEIPDIIKNVVGNGRFLNSSLRAFDNADVVAFFEGLGVPLKTERGKRVFPQSDRALDVVDAMLKYLHDHNVEIRTNATVRELIFDANTVRGVRLADGTCIEAVAVILATGGASYPATGSTGDGYALARAAGHTVTPIFPALVPLVTQETWVRDVQGLSLRNVRATLYHAGKKEQDFFGEMLFTHFGVTGPIILQLSRRASELLTDGQKDIELRLNLKPALTHEKLRERVDRDFAAYEQKQIHNGMVDLLPKRLIDIVLNAAGLAPERIVGQISSKECERLVHTLQALPLTIVGTRPIAEAIVTAGGSQRVRSTRAQWNRRLCAIYTLPESWSMSTRTQAAITCRRRFRWGMPQVSTAYGTWKGLEQNGGAENRRGGTVRMAGRTDDSGGQIHLTSQRYVCGAWRYTRAYQKLSPCRGLPVNR